MIKYLISSFIISVTHIGIILGIFILHLMGKIPDIIYLILLTTLIVTFLESSGISTEKYLTPIIERKNK